MNVDSKTIDGVWVFPGEVTIPSSKLNIYRAANSLKGRPNTYNIDTLSEQQQDNQMIAFMITTFTRLCFSLDYALSSGLYARSIGLRNCLTLSEVIKHR